MAVKWGIVGASGVAHRRTMPAINLAENGELYALMVRDLGRAEKLAQGHGASVYYDSVEDILSDPEVDAVYIATPVYLHHDHVIQAAEHGKHVLCEKPMAMSVDECKSMIDACEQNGVRLGICLLLRHHPGYHDIKRMIEDGRFGEIVEARVSFLKWYPMEPGLWRRDPVRAGGGVLLDMGAHAIDLLCFLLGDASKVTAFISSQVAGWEVEETATVLIQMKNGAHAIADVSFVAPHGGNMLEIYGTKGSVLIGGGKMKTYINDSVQEEPMRGANTFKEQVEHFARHIAGEEDSIVPGIVGLKNVQIISAAYESVRTDSTISIS